MGVIKDGSVSGFIPANTEADAFVVHYPGYPSSMLGALHTLGGLQALQKARALHSNRLELHFRPQDPYSHPALGDLRPCYKLLLRICKTKSANITGKVEPKICADIVARVQGAYHFDGMADYQHVIAVHANVARTKKRKWIQDEPISKKNGHTDVDEEDVMIIVPPVFAPKDVPENLVLKPSVTFTSKKNQEAVAQPYLEIDLEPVLAIDFNINEIPKRINWEEYISEGSDQWESQMAVSRLFDERPIWTKHSLNERLTDHGFALGPHMLRRLLSRVAYYFSTGPFLRFWIKKGYDPRKDPESRIYQRIDFRVHQSLRSYCDANTANQGKQRWEDICSFRVYPFKCQTSFQLFELLDDYVQQQIRKPPATKTCTYATGWFSSAMLDNLRQRITIRFLSVYPKPVVERLLREATDNFEKSKRRLNKDHVMHSEEEQEEVDTGVGGDEYVADAEDDEEEESDTGNEEEAFPMHNIDVNMENISRHNLQELFVSFPSGEPGNHQMRNSDEEYQIFEQGSDENLSDEDDY